MMTTTTRSATAHAAAAVDDRTDRPSSSTLQRVVFHGSGVLAFALATAVALAAAFFVAFGTSTCNDDDVSDELRQLRIGLLVVGTVLALVPAGWSYLASRLRLAWWPWLALSATVLVATLGLVASTNQVSTFCF
jgi:hypothetical protein